MMVVLYEICSLINFNLGPINIGRLLRLAVLFLHLYIYIVVAIKLTLNLYVNESQVLTFCTLS
jgi:hypothetical protein